MRSKDYFKRPCELVCEKCHADVSFYVGSSVQREWVVGYIGTLGNRHSQLVSRIVLNDFTDDSLCDLDG